MKSSNQLSQPASQQQPEDEKLFFSPPFFSPFNIYLLWTDTVKKHISPRLIQGYQNMMVYVYEGTIRVDILGTRQIEKKFFLKIKSYKKGLVFFPSFLLN